MLNFLSSWKNYSLKKKIKICWAIWAERQSKLDHVPDQRNVAKKLTFPEKKGNMVLYVVQIRA